MGGTKQKYDMALKNKVEEEEHLRDLREPKRRNRDENVLHGPMHYAKTLTLRFRAGDLDLPERRKRYTSSREEEKERCTDAPLWQSSRE